nr:hypothetical protein CFP56_37170 [Quercus suber]
MYIVLVDILIQFTGPGDVSGTQHRLCRIPKICRARDRESFVAPAGPARIRCGWVTRRRTRASVRLCGCDHYIPYEQIRKAGGGEEPGSRSASSVDGVQGLLTLGLTTIECFGRRKEWEDACNGASVPRDCHVEKTKPWQHAKDRKMDVISVGQTSVDARQDRGSSHVNCSRDKDRAKREPRRAESSAQHLHD